VSIVESQHRVLLVSALVVMGDVAVSAARDDPCAALASAWQQSPCPRLSATATTPTLREGHRHDRWTRDPESWHTRAQRYSFRDAAL